MNFILYIYSTLYFHSTQHPLLYGSKDYSVFCFHTFQGYNVFCFMIANTTMSFAFMFSKTSMSSVFYIFKDYHVLCFMIPRLQCLLHYDFKDFNVFSLLHFRRLQCLQYFTLSKTIMSSVF